MSINCPRCGSRNTKGQLCSDCAAKIMKGDPLKYPNPANDVIAAQQLAARQHEQFLSSVYGTINIMRNALIAALEDGAQLKQETEEQVRKALLGMGI